MDYSEKIPSVSPQLSFMNSKDLIIVCSTYVSRVSLNFSQSIRY